MHNLHSIQWNTLKIQASASIFLARGVAKNEPGLSEHFLDVEEHCKIINSNK